MSRWKRSWVDQCEISCCFALSAVAPMDASVCLVGGEEATHLAGAGTRARCVPRRVAAGGSR